MFDPLQDKDLPGILDKCTSVYQLYRLKPRKRKIIPDNLEPWIGLNLAIWSPTANSYFLRELMDLKVQWPTLKKYMHDGNLYIVWGDIEKEEIAIMMERLEVEDYWSQFVPLIEKSVELYKVQHNMKDRLGYYTKIKQLEEEIEQIKKL